MSFSGLDREEITGILEKEYFDIIIIGGGVTGAGIALDAASRGLKTALIEKNDFASGTSSKSTKLIHGGLRYLKQFEFSLVREVGKERAIVHQLAPHLVRPEKMLLPLIKDGTYGSIMTSVGLMVYDVLANVDKEDQRKMLSAEATMELEPLLKKDVVEGGGLYAEYQTDDYRLVIELIKASRDFGAVVLNYAQVEKILEEGGIACGVACKDNTNGHEFNIYGDYVVNATGPWVDEVRSKSEEVKGKSLHLTKGTHLVVPKEKLHVKHAVYFDVPDGRMIFAIPRGKTTYLGTTDTDYKGDPSNAVVDKDDSKYILDAVNNMFPSVNLTEDDVVSSWAGIRPLIAEEGKSASEISRKDEIFVAKNQLISIAGGKLTGYRQMAKKIVSKVMKMKEEKSGISKKVKCKTKKILLPGNGFKNYKAVKNYKEELKRRYQSIDANSINYLVDIYGTQCNDILDNFNDSQLPSDEEKLFEAELKFCLENEMVLTLMDFYERRTGRLYFDIESIGKTMSQAKGLFTQFLSLSDKEIESQQQDLNDAVKLATSFK